jgi:TonB family protein
MGPVAPRGRLDADGSDRKPDLRPGAAAIQALTGLGSPDKINDVDEGEQTFLNTRQFRFAGFFNRVKEELYYPWSDEIRRAIEARDPTGQRFLYKDRTTWLEVRLDAQGHLKGTAVLERSGADFLDEAARRAFIKVGAFANPPPALVDENGEIRFAFGFTINGVSDLPTFRYRYTGP